MPRSNRPRRGARSVEHDEADISRLTMGMRRVETRRDGDWNVQPVSGASAQKVYTCPGCSGAVSVGTAHLVTWRADGIMGEADDLAARRHWHTRCWSIRR